MSFQHFRLGELSLHQPLPPHLAALPGAPASSTSTFSAAINPTSSPFAPSSKAASKAPYGSGDTDDGYTLVFPNLEAFHEWRAQEEERQTVEFVKGDTHGSKAVPPRFKDHTKLVCARHSRSGRKKYVKKHPERVRKVPSRKHSHEIGLANLPFTRRGRKAAQREKERATTSAPVADSSPPASTNAGPSSAPPQEIPNNMFASTVSMVAPLPQSPYPHPPPQPFQFAHVPHQFQAPPPGMHPGISHDRWENMATLFSSVREHARGFEYPSVSVAALETVLIRLYLESPVGLGSQPSMAAIMQNQMPQPRPQPPQPQPVQSAPQANGNTSDGSGEDSS
ncbi:hypothetical protein DXG03_008080 [Asterophora parasitica]|uniref:Uncharacterized protein n=1 Tax=Asterophora parasitica TaxID=117018 RepID=A0A9P7GCC0_9AGAR|nr:hypothetical protein DXG03_008080 [Asterophora parasitica]